MKRLVTVTLTVLFVGAFATAAMAQGWGPMGMRPGAAPMMGAAGGPMGPQMDRGPMEPMAGRMAMHARMAGGAGHCPMMAGAAGETVTPATPPAATPVTEEKATALATEYAAKYLKDYKVERVLPWQGRFHTMFQVELKGPKGETRFLHVNPWGAVRPFAAPFTASE